MTTKKCPLIKGACMEHGCHWYMQLLGNDPQTGAPKNEFGCAMAWLPILLIENSQASRQTGAAVESFRNEMVDGNVAAAKQALTTLSLLSEASKGAKQIELKSGDIHEQQSPSTKRS